MRTKRPASNCRPPHARLSWRAGFTRAESPTAAEAAARRALRLSGERGPVAYDAYVTLAHFEALQSRNDAATAYLASAEATPGEHPATERRNACMVRALIAATSGRLLEAFDDYERKPFRSRVSSTIQNNSRGR